MYLFINIKRMNQFICSSPSVLGFTIKLFEQGIECDFLLPCGLMCCIDFILYQGSSFKSVSFCENTTAQNTNIFFQFLTLSLYEPKIGQTFIWVSVFYWIQYFMFWMFIICPKNIFVAAYSAIYLFIFYFVYTIWIYLWLKSGLGPAIWINLYQVNGIEIENLIENTKG